MSMRYLGGFITASYNPLKVPNPPTIDSVTPGPGEVSVAFTAPYNDGGSAITSFVVLVTDSSSGATFTNSGAASPIVVTGLSAGETYTAKVLAVNAYGPSGFSAPSGSFNTTQPKLYSWGSNLGGQLGLNDIANRSSPVQVGALTDWSQVAVGEDTNFAIKTNGTLWSWGANNFGELGQNIAFNIDRSSPVQVGALTDWYQVSTGQGFCAAIKTDGTLWSWGKNTNGQLGLDDIANRSSPVQVGAETDWAQISAGITFCAAIKTNGTLWTWGASGAFALVDTTNRSSPVQVGALTDWAQVSAGGFGCAAIKTNGTLFTWGNNNVGQLGQGNVISLSSPVQVGSLTTWKQVSAGNDHCAAIISQDLPELNGTLFTWGDNGDGQLGQNIAFTTNRSAPVQVGALTDWSQVSALFQGCRAIKTTGTLWSWGDNGNGALGLNIAVTINRSSPVQVGALTNWGKLGQGCRAQSTLAILN